jgi:hypothetical protein
VASTINAAQEAGTMSAKPDTGPESTSRPRLLTYAEFAAENRISIDTVRRKVDRGELTIRRPSPRRVLIEATA